MAELQFFDTHCHIHSSDYPLDQAEVIANAIQEGVGNMLCVGTDLEDSELAAQFAQDRSNVRASAGIHPHEAERYVGKKALLDRFKLVAALPQTVAIGECGLDYFYTHSPKKDQVAMLHFQIETALEHNLPLIFHVRDAFGDFWPVFDQYKGLTGVIHSFTAGPKVLDEVLARGLFVGLNGITTFMKPGDQLDAVKQVPQSNLVLETDAPFLTPVPFRGTMNEPKHVRRIAEHLAELRGEDIAAIASATTANAKKLLKLEH